MHKYIYTVNIYKYIYTVSMYKYIYTVTKYKYIYTMKFYTEHFPYLHFFFSHISKIFIY